MTVTERVVYEVNRAETALQAASEDAEAAVVHSVEAAVEAAVEGAAEAADELSLPTWAVLVPALLLLYHLLCVPSARCLLAIRKRWRQLAKMKPGRSASWPRLHGRLGYRMAPEDRQLLLHRRAVRSSALAACGCQRGQGKSSAAGAAECISPNPLLHYLHPLYLCYLQGRCLACLIPGCHLHDAAHCLYPHPRC